MISINVVYATSKGSEQPGHTCSLIRAFASCLNYSMNVKLLTKQHLEFLSLTEGCTGSSESIHVKMPHCWKSHVAAHLSKIGMTETPSKDIGFLCILFQVNKKFRNPNPHKDPIIVQQQFTPIYLSATRTLESSSLLSVFSDILINKWLKVYE